MRRNIGKTYIKKEKKWNLIITLITIAVVAVVIAVIELLPGSAPELGYSDMNGVGRSFMYPFVFLDSNSNLYLMKEDCTVTAIDDAVAAPVHDSVNDQIYYLRNNVLYEYSIKSNDRVALCENVTGFSLMGNRRAIVCTNTSNQIQLYLFKGDQTRLLSETRDGEPSASAYAVSSEGVLLADGGKLIYSDYTGQMRTISENLNSSRKFYLSKDGGKICYYEGDIMYIADTDGNILLSSVNAQPVLSQVEPVLLDPSTKELDSDGSVPFRYFLSDISMVYHPEQNGASEYTAGLLQYLDGDELKEIARNVYRLLYYSEADDFLLYSVLNGDGMDIYMTSKGGAPEKQISCGVNARFIFDARTNYLYYQEADGLLCRYNIYDVRQKTVTVAENTGNIYNYYNKPFIAYENADGSELYLVLKNQIERFDAAFEMRLYGRSNEIYLLCRQNGDGLMSLDYVVEDKMTRIAGNVGTNVFFDRDMEYIVYNSDAKLYVWHNGEITCAGEYQDVKAVDIIK